MTTSEPLSAELKSEKDEKKQIHLELPKPGVVDEHFASFAEERGQRLVEFQRKYNFDFVKDVPLPGGRYEWFPVNSSHEKGDQGPENNETKTSGAG